MHVVRFGIHVFGQALLITRDVDLLNVLALTSRFTSFLEYLY